MLFSLMFGGKRRGSNAVAREHWGASAPSEILFMNKGIK